MKKQTKITAALIAKRRVICIRPTMPQERERERRKYLEPKKYEKFKKKEAVRVREYRLKKKDVRTFTGQHCSVNL